MAAGISVFVEATSGLLAFSSKPILPTAWVFLKDISIFSTCDWIHHPSLPHIITLHTLAHPNHLILATAVPAPSPFSSRASLSSSSSCGAIVGFNIFTRRTTSKLDRPQLPPLATPYPKGRHKRDASNLQCPP